MRKSYKILQFQQVLNSRLSLVYRVAEGVEFGLCKKASTFRLEASGISIM